MNWNSLDRVLGAGKYFSLMTILFILLLNVSFSFANPMIDNYGHIGGLIFGFFLIFVIHKPDEAEDGMCCPHKIWYWISFSILVTFYVGGLLLFFLK
jgi:hypothetical protein